MTVHSIFRLFLLLFFRLCKRSIEFWEDPLSFEYIYEVHSSYPNEIRWYKFGRLKDGRIIRVVYVELSNNIFRIITAYSNIKFEEIYYEIN